MTNKLLKRYALVVSVSLVLLGACVSKTSLTITVTSGEKNVIGNAMTNWLALDAVQWQGEQLTFESAFNKGLPLSTKELWQSLQLGNITIDGNVHNWRNISSLSPIIDLGTILGRTNNAYSFLATSLMFQRQVSEYWH